MPKCSSVISIYINGYDQRYYYSPPAHPLCSLDPAAGTASGGSWLQSWLLWKPHTMEVSYTMEVCDRTKLSQPCSKKQTRLGVTRQRGCVGEVKHFVHPQVCALRASGVSCPSGRHRQRRPAGKQSTSNSV